MRTRALPIAVLMLLAAGPARAGVYNLSDANTLTQVYGGKQELVAAAQRLNALPSAMEVDAHLFKLRAAAIEPKDGRLDEFSPRALYLRQIEYYERQRKAGPLDAFDAVSLAGCYLILGDVKSARRVLDEADRGHFLVQASLAATFQQARNYDWALDHQKRALALWPKVWAGWPAELLAFYRECEQYNLRVLEFRKANPDESPTGAITIDPLFPYVPPVRGGRLDARPKGRDLDLGLKPKAAGARAEPLRFVNEQGKYAAGELAREEADKLPKNAANLVLQITLWQPRDRRLCWLLAELLNAFGHVEPAARLLTSMVETEKLEWPELRQHQLVLEKAAPVKRQLRSAKTAYLLSGELLMIPQGRLGTPIAGDVAYHYAALCAPQALAPAHDDPNRAFLGQGQQGQGGQGPEDAGTLSPAAPLPFNLQHVVVSFVFGALVAALLGLQWQALRRRRPANESPTGEPAPSDAAAGPKAEGVMQEAPPS